MLDQIKLNLYYFFKVSWLNIVIFWTIYLGFVAFMFVLVFTFKDSDITFTGVNVLPSLIFSFIYGLLFLKDTFPYVIKLGVNRNSYVLSLLIYTILFSLIMLTISQLSLYVIDKLIKLFSIDNFQFTGIEIVGLTNIGKADIILYEGLLYLISFICTVFLGSIFFRFGMKIGFVILAIIPLSLAVEPIMTTIFDLVKYIAIGHEKYNEFAFAIPFALIAILMWLIMSKASVVDKTAK